MQRLSIIFMVTVSALVSLGVGLLGPVYTIFVVDRFSASLVDVGVLSAVFGFVAAVFKVPSGRLVDLYGKEKVLFVGLVPGAICSLSYVLAFDLYYLYIIEFLFGVSYALQSSSLLALTMTTSSKDNRGLLLGVFDSAYDVAGAVAAILSGIIVSRFGFEPLFLACSGFHAITGFFILIRKYAFLKGHLHY